MTKTILDFFSPSNKSRLESNKPEVTKSSSIKTVSTVICDNFDDFYKPETVVWAKLGDYPWWPSVIFKHPTSRSYCKTEADKEYLHVQFFETPPSRSWVLKKFVKKFDIDDIKNRSVGGLYFSTYDGWAASVAAALITLQTNAGKHGLTTANCLSSEEEDVSDRIRQSVKRRRVIIDDSDEENVPMNNDNAVLTTPQPKKKRAKLVKRSESASSGSDYCPEEVDSSSESDVRSECDSESDRSSSPIKHKKSKVALSNSSVGKKKNVKTNSSLSSPRVLQTPPSSNSTPRRPTSMSLSTKSKLNSFVADDSIVDESNQSACTNLVEGQWDHLSFKWLWPEHRKDKNGRKIDHPEYDSNTLHVPKEFLDKVSPGMKQWWQLKSEHAKIILFFKVGKFYELYHEDAVVGVQQLGLSYMRGSFAHSGFPEVAYGRMADQLVAKGYSVARVEQTESSDSMTERTRGKSVKERVVRREICRVTTPGLQGLSSNWDETTELSAVARSRYLLALKECDCIPEQGARLFGVAFVDAAIGKVFMGQFNDDRHCSHLRTLIAHYPPSQILVEKGRLHSNIQHLLNSCLAGVPRELLSSGSEFWDSSRTLQELSEASYFRNEASSDIALPTALRTCLSNSDTLGRTARPDKEAAISALGALVFFLRRCLVDHEVLSMGNFQEYLPLQQQEQLNNVMFYDSQEHMVLDGVTLCNLDVLFNSTTSSTSGTLLERLDCTRTQFGHRLLRQWLCAPLCRPEAIRQRQDAIAALLDSDQLEVVNDARKRLSKLPDLQRLLAKIHGVGANRPDLHHPDTRAVFYEEKIYSKRKCSDFLAAIQGFKDSVQIAELFKNVAAVVQLTCAFPDLSQELAFFDSAFDHEEARREGRIVPEAGLDEQYDSSVQGVARMESALQTYLAQQCRALNSRITFIGTGRNRYQMEVSDAVARSVPRSWELASQRKGFKRYKSSESESLFAELQTFEEQRTQSLQDLMRRVFSKFDSYYLKWQAAVNYLATLDVLLTLAEYPRNGEGDFCKPSIFDLKNGQKPFLEILSGRHPCLTRTFLGGDFIPNDTLIGDVPLLEGQQANEEGARLLLLTGPNMGGKSTLMRQVALITILAQIGSFVPASQCRLTPCDRVFTRLGASDHIMSGESTFFVELSETSAILAHASLHSLVLLDELGRGTATYDGTAIACAVVASLAHDISCLTLFSTHYHSLVEEFKHDVSIKLVHMACMENEETEAGKENENIAPSIIFLYKLVTGACPNSYGFHVARLAGLSESVIARGANQAHQLQTEVNLLKLLCELLEGRLLRDELLAVC